MMLCDTEKGLGTPFVEAGARVMRSVRVKGLGMPSGEVKAMGRLIGRGSVREMLGVPATGTGSHGATVTVMAMPDVWVTVTVMPIVVAWGMVPPCEPERDLVMPGAWDPGVGMPIVEVLGKEMPSVMRPGMAMLGVEALGVGMPIVEVPGKGMPSVMGVGSGTL